nr:MAG TPA: hypothetical protein [Caudoviricetes sp.]
MFFFFLYSFIFSPKLIMFPPCIFYINTWKLYFQ